MESAWTPLTEEPLCKKMEFLSIQQPVPEEGGNVDTSMTRDKYFLHTLYLPFKEKREKVY